eukprot:gnl/TRDRNA2_/TRDRNA2_201411_c0_seq1.p1 gnl/TRDRNA2_/TRDRNA2_201411_c0~~gnl/TRDRNA2_/TRDRNA2_201411_c0_seq1.p1  ORF type:complete len:301 (+),score=29.92 gnl/TRDRNA2_/TRDRNA2_201411_c0_seq1:117-1019(+)
MASNDEEDPLAFFPSHLINLIRDLNHGYQSHSPFFSDDGFCKPPLEWLLREGDGLHLDIAGNDSMTLFYECVRFFWQRNQLRGTLAQQFAVGFCWTVDESFEIWRRDVLRSGCTHFGADPSAAPVVHSNREEFVFFGSWKIRSVPAASKVDLSGRIANDARSTGHDDNKVADNVNQNADLPVDPIPKLRRVLCNRCSEGDGQNANIKLLFYVCHKIPLRNVPESCQPKVGSTRAVIPTSDRTLVDVSLTDAPFENFLLLFRNCVELAGFGNGQLEENWRALESQVLAAVEGQVEERAVPA